MLNWISYCLLRQGPKGQQIRPLQEQPSGLSVQQSGTSTVSDVSPKVELPDSPLLPMSSHQGTTQDCYVHLKFNILGSDLAWQSTKNICFILLEDVGYAWGYAKGSIRKASEHLPLDLRRAENLAGQGWGFTRGRLNARNQGCEDQVSWVRAQGGGCHKNQSLLLKEVGCPERGTGAFLCRK